VQRTPKIELIILTLFILGMASCLKKDVYPDEPVIVFKDVITKGDSLAIVTISFTDGDGDIGVSDNEPDARNFFINYWEKQKGTWKVIDLPLPFNQRIPYLIPATQRRALQGDIIDSIKPFYFDFTSPYDTFRYEIYIKDRADHESNHVFTGELIKQ